MLQPDDPSEFLQTTGVRLAVRPGLRLPPGRGVLLADRVPTIVQVGTHTGAAARDALSAGCLLRLPRRRVDLDPTAAVLDAAIPSASTRESAVRDPEPAHM